MRVTGEHSHDNNLLSKIAKEKLNDAVKAASTLPTVVPRTIAANVTNQMMAECPLAVNFLPKYKTIARQIQRARAKESGCAVIPTDWPSMTVPDHLQRTEAGEDFLIIEDTIDENDEAKVIGFGSPNSLEILNTSDDWFGDGTFSIVSTTLFAQVVTYIHDINRLANEC